MGEPLVRRWGSIAAVVAASVLTALGASRIGMPLAWMIGPMLAATCFAVAGLPVAWPTLPRRGGQVIVATAVGLHFSPEALAQTLSYLPHMIVAATTTGIAALCLIPIMVRTAPTNAVTALLSCVPGGPAEMAALAQKAGGNGAHVAIAQSLRIGLVVIIVPTALQISQAEVVVRAATLVPLAAASTGLLGALALSVVAALGFHRFGVSSPYFLGPLGAASLFTAAGVPAPEFPRMLLWGGQLLLGISIGLSFSKELLRSAPRFILVSAGSTILLMLICVAIGWGLATVTGLPVTTMLLATAPASVTEMSLTAEAMGLGVALVTAFHIVRLFLLLPFMPIVIRWIARRPS